MNARARTELARAGYDPDPYYGTAADFARVLALLETGMAHLVAQLAADPAIGAVPELPG